MNKTFFTRRNIWIISFVAMAIILGSLLRFLQTPPNFAPIAAIALFGGAYILDKRIALVLPLAIMLLSDLMLHIFYPGWGFHNVIPFVYGSFIIITLIGFVIRQNPGILNVAGASIAGSILFFLITNFGVWAMNFMYPQNITGLMASYTAAIPFFKNTLMSDMLFNAIFFGSFYFLDYRYPALKKA